MKTPRRLLIPLIAAVFAAAASALAQAQPSAPSVPPPTDDKLDQSLKDIRGQLPSQSHTMIDVAYHFNGLWFAGSAQNWPLAEFLLSETKSHLRWAVRVRPVRPLSGGREFHVGDMLTAIEQNALKELAESIQAKDQPRFVAAYKQQLASCYACHVAAEKPYLRLKLPERPTETMLEFDPTKPGSPTP